jgi:hypothetical protein
MEDTITISVERYNELIRSEKILNALYAGGVDNWEWYEEALENMDDE